MIATYFKLSYRSLINKKHNSFISVLGLGIGLATVMLIGAYIINEKSFDKFHKNYNSVYRLVNKTSNKALLDKEYATSFFNDLPGIEKACRMNMFPAMLGNETNPVNIERMAITDSTFFQIFSFPLLIGSPMDVLNGPNKIVLSKSLAAKLFPNTSAVGRLVRIDMKEFCTVTGIMEDSPVNSSIQPDAVVSIYTKNIPWTGGDYWNNNGRFHIELFQYYILLRNEKDTLQTLKYLRNTYVEKWASEKPDLVLQPFSEIYSTTGIDETGNLNHSNKKLLLLLLSIGGAVLLLAIINTINILLSESFEETVWKSMCPDLTLNYFFYDDMIEKQYLQERRLTATIGSSSGIAIFISCLGLLSMILFIVKRRTKEIGIYKINGARVLEVMLMQVKDFVKWVIIAFVIISPIAWYVMHKWLQNFAYKTELSWWIFVLAGIIALGIALITVSWQTWRAATRNPVEALRYE